MLNRFMRSFLVSVALITVSSSMASVPAMFKLLEKPCTNSLTLTNLVHGNADMAWQFDRPESSYTVTISYDATQAVITSFSTASTSATVSNLPTGVSLKFMVSNSTGYVIITDIINL